MLRRIVSINEADSMSSSNETVYDSDEIVENGRAYTFRVLVNDRLEQWERVAVTGKCSSLGIWSPARCVLLDRENDSNIWSGEVNIPENEIVPYRFLICSIEPKTENVHVRRWETHAEPRQISADCIENTVIDTFGVINGVTKVDRGWLTTETMFQFKLIHNPFTLKQSLKDRMLSVKLTPMDMNDDCGKEQIYAFTEVSSLKSKTNTFEPQVEFGRLYEQDDIVVFNVTVGDPENVAYRVDLYTYDNNASNDTANPQHLGYHYILPNFVRSENGKIEMPITCAKRHLPLGTMKMEYFRTCPYSFAESLTLERSFVRYWNESWKGLEIGHRGAGPFEPNPDDEVYPDNTIASLRRSIRAGAKMIEFDVMLSKDMIPVVTHDFNVELALRRRKSLITEGDQVDLPTSDLTFEQLRRINVFNRRESKAMPANIIDEYEPFPLLCDLFDSLDDDIGFNIEIKWNMELAKGTFESDRINKNPNHYLDVILDVVLDKASSRYVVFSCFDPDLCAALRAKQNLYPVMFLSQGLTDRYDRFYDPRGDSIENAAFHASTNELLGIVVHTIDVLDDLKQLYLVKELGLICFCWGHENNNREMIEFLKNQHMDGVIYDL